MKEQASSLMQTVARFKLGDEQRMVYDNVRSSEPRPASRMAAPRSPRSRTERPTPLRGATVTALRAPQASSQGNGEWQEF
jgi:hypothetical protein